MLANWTLQTSMKRTRGNTANRFLDVEATVDDNNEEDEEDEEGNDGASAGARPQCPKFTVAIS